MGKYDMLNRLAYNQVYAESYVKMIEEGTSLENVNLTGLSKGDIVDIRERMNELLKAKGVNTVPHLPSALSCPRNPIGWHR